MGGLVGFFISTFVIVIFGEILPQALCNKWPLEIAGNTAFILYFYMVVTSPISYPLSLIFEKIFGKEEDTFLTNSQMRKLFEMQEKDNLIKPSESNILSIKDG